MILEKDYSMKEGNVRVVKMLWPSSESGVDYTLLDSVVLGEKA